MGMNATFSLRRKSLIVTAVAVAAAGGVAAAVIPAFAAGGNRADHAGHTGGAGIVSQSGTVAGGKGGTILAASLRGANEVPVAGGPAVGDKDGAALQFVKVKGDKVSVAVKWRGTDKPTLLHIHQGAKGTNGGVKVDFTKLLAGAKGKTVTGTVKVDDAALLNSLKSDPGSFYANLHTAEFPGGAVRGQLHKVTTAFDFRDALDNFQASVLKGKQIYECKLGRGRRVRLRPTGRQRPPGRTDRALLRRAQLRYAAVDRARPQRRHRIGHQQDAQRRQEHPGAGPQGHPVRQAPRAPRRHRGDPAAEHRRRRRPVSSCEPGAIVGVPYQADYVFIQR